MDADATATINFDQLQDARLMDQVLEANLPQGVFWYVPASDESPEDQRHQADAREDIQNGTASPVLNKLRDRILLKCRENGQPIPKAEFTPAKTYELTPAEKLKKERRREQNRRAARKCREKKKKEESGVHEQYQETTRLNRLLHGQVKALQMYASTLKAWLVAHLAVCSIWPPSTQCPTDQTCNDTHHQIRQQDRLQQQDPPPYVPQQNQIQRQQQEPLWQQPQEEPPPYMPQPVQQEEQLPSLEGKVHSLYCSSPPSPIASVAPETVTALLQQQNASLSQSASSNVPGALMVPQYSHPSMPVPNAVPETVTVPLLQYLHPSCPADGTSPYSPMTPCSMHEEPPNLGSQGFDSICANMQANQDFCLDSQELNTIFVGISASSQESSGTGVSPSASSSATHGQPDSLNSLVSSCGSSWSMSAPTSTMTTMSAQSSHHFLTSDQNLQPLCSEKSPITAPLSENPVSSDLPELPGFPFSQRRKRKSVDSSVLDRQEDGCSRSKMPKSATYHNMVKSSSTSSSSDAGSHFVFPSLPLDGGSSSTVKLFRDLCERSTPTPPSPFPSFLRRGTPSPCTPALSPAPSPHSPGSMQFLTSTLPPQRCSGATVPSTPTSCVPSSPNHCHSCSSSTPQPTVPVPSLVVLKPRAPMVTGASPAPESTSVSRQQSLAIMENLSEDLMNFIASSQCAGQEEGESSCLSSQNIQDFLYEHLTSSQED